MTKTPRLTPEEQWSRDWTEVNPPREVPSDRITSIPYGTIIKVEGGRWEGNAGYFYAQPEGDELMAQKLPEGWQPGRPVPQQGTYLTVKVHPEFGQKVTLVAFPSDAQIEWYARNQVSGKIDHRSREIIDQKRGQIRDLMSSLEPAAPDYSI
ncbi:MAG: hypothetical protein PHE68_03005 [Candidatus Peribacteraceae bacterium]|nr:hypothetical protein [Candidatus Peribacteraceae bacterium]MDD5074263.1 hypothetical protein [Candidatus Peribacteraceae bacterium]